MLEWWQYLVLACAACAAGFIDAIAGGGGLIAVPALLWTGLSPTFVLGTNKLQSTCGTALAVAQYTRAGLIPWRKLRLGIVITFIAAILGAWVFLLLDRTNPVLLKRIIPFLLIAVAIYTLLNPGLGNQTHPAKLGPVIFALLFGTLLGFYDGFFGPGTGSFWMLACVLTLGLDLRAATGTTKGLNLASNLAALLAFAAVGCVRYDAGAVMIAGQLVGARLGSGLVITKGIKIIRPIFILTALALALRTAWVAFH